MKGEQSVWGRMMKFWAENTAQGPLEHAINRYIVESMRLVNAGMLPTFQMTPSPPMMRATMEMMTAGRRKGSADFRSLLESHIDFAEVPSWGPRPQHGVPCQMPNFAYRRPQDARIRRAASRPTIADRAKQSPGR